MLQYNQYINNINSTKHTTFMDDLRPLISSYSYQYNNNITQKLLNGIHKVSNNIKFQIQPLKTVITRHIHDKLLENNIYQHIFEYNNQPIQIDKPGLGKHLGILNDNENDIQKKLDKVKGRVIFLQNINILSGEIHLTKIFQLINSHLISIFRHGIASSKLDKHYDKINNIIFKPLAIKYGLKRSKLTILAILFDLDIIQVIDICEKIFIIFKICKFDKFHFDKFEKKCELVYLITKDKNLNKLFVEYLNIEISSIIKDNKLLNVKQLKTYKKSIKKTIKNIEYDKIIKKYLKMKNNIILSSIIESGTLSTNT